MTDQPTEGEVVTKRDVYEGNVDKVFPHGLPEHASALPALIAPRPGWIINSEEMTAAKALALGGPMLPSWVRGNVGVMLHIMQICKRWSKYDERTNSWIMFDPSAVASQMYLVEGKQGQTIGWSSQFVGALVDGFTSARLRFRYEGAGQERVCICYGRLGRDPEPFEYMTPPLKTITPKRSPVWESDPDRQLAYYARRNWARLFTPGVLLGVYDVEELEGRVVHKVRDVTPIGAAEKLHERLRAAAEAHEGDREGFNGQPAELAGQDEPEAVQEPQERPGPVSRRVRKGKSAKAASEAREGKARPSTARPRGRTPAPGREPADRTPPGPAAADLPTTPAQYEKWVEAWLPALDTEEKIEARWRSEMKLRNFCGVVEEQRAMIRMKVDARVQQVRQ